MWVSQLTADKAARCVYVWLRFLQLSVQNQNRRLPSVAQASNSALMHSILHKFRSCSATLATLSQTLSLGYKTGAKWTTLSSLTQASRPSCLWLSLERREDDTHQQQQSRRKQVLPTTERESRQQPSTSPSNGTDSSWGGFFWPIAS